MTQPRPSDHRAAGRALLLPVIHHLDVDTSIEQAAFAFEHGADGVFLIEMAGDSRRPERAAVAIKRAHPDRLVGMNRLGVDPVEALLADSRLGLDMTWSDYAGLNTDPAARWAAGRIVAISTALDLVRASRPHLFFAAVAFKGHSCVRSRSHKGWCHRQVPQVACASQG